MTESNPYSGLPAKAFWRTGALETHPLAPSSLYGKKFDIAADDSIATLGSCFAQHISRALREVGLNVLDCEPAPSGLPRAMHQTFGYATYSARFANIYTSRQLLQLLREAFEGQQSPDPVWEKNGRYYDSMRPSVEPEGLASPQEVSAHRAYHLAQVRKLVESVDLFIFTLGLTECWGYRGTDWVFPTAPGTIAGTYEPEKDYEFRNLTYPEILADMEAVIALVSAHSKSKNLRFLFTVSPVPLTASYSGDHVLVSTTYSKSVLRAVVGDLVNKYPNAAYFPSYEMVVAPISRGVFFDPNMRTVNRAGVDVIMGAFKTCHGFGAQSGAAATAAPRASGPVTMDDLTDDVVCEEALLDAFAKR